jgi:hypothetical protein
VADDNESEEDFAIDPRAMDFLEQKLLKLYETLPRKDRIDLKENGTVAVGAVRKKGKKPRLKEPMFVYTTASNGGSTGFHDAAKSLDLIWWLGDAGVTKRILYGPPRLHPPNSPPPNDKGGIEHAEQFMIGYAEDNGYVIDGMAVSRFLCEDCQDVIPRYRKGWMTISVKLDPDKTLPKQRALNWKRKQEKAAQEAAQKETGGEPAQEKPIPPPDPETDKSLKRLVDDRCADAVKIPDNPERWKELLAQARKFASEIKDETMRKIAENTILNAENKILGR